MNTFEHHLFFRKNYARRVINDTIEIASKNKNRNVTADSVDTGVDMKKGSKPTFADVVKGKSNENNDLKSVRLSSTH